MSLTGLYPVINILVPGRLCAVVQWTGKSVSINARSTIGRKKIKNKVIPIIIKSPKYSDFCESVIMQFLTQWQSDKISTGVFMAYYIGPHFWMGKQKDADAFHKPIQDGLEKAGVLENDKLILSYAMIPLEPNESMDYVRVELYDMPTIKDIQVKTYKESISNV